MTERTYRTKEETVELFRKYRTEFETIAQRETDPIIKSFLRGKAEAYGIAAFEIDTNME